LNAEKKKMIVIGVLGAVLLGVGVFQFTSGSPEEPKPKPKKQQSGANQETIIAESSETAEQIKDLMARSTPGVDNALSQLYSYPLSPRDPFARGSASLRQVETPHQPAPQPPRRTSTPRPTVPPFRIEGELPGPLTMAPPGVSLQPGAEIRSPDEFTYTLSGVILGTRPAAVFSDEAGNQRLVPLGSSLDGDSRVTGVSAGKVTVRHRGKTLTLSVGGTP